ncbi:hypothetical protein V3C99_006304 [Haemonchus contortus]|uniref:DUF1206 domain-containing protein n=1 Tax=Haemonchus contortus TaxID=6289 RepID=A0A7I4Z6B7_HAECO
MTCTNEHCRRVKFVIMTGVAVVVGWLAYSAYQTKKRRNSRRRDF